ncbi:MAG: XRE family transcriptional regulator [Campylobacterales bacterium]|nr:XRE family transcriptional regulator [Campylobacterales bacterium]
MEAIDFNNEEIAEFYGIIGKNVAKIRKEKGVSQLELTLAMGYNSSGLVSQAELTLNKKHFNIEHLHKISKLLKVDICEFFRPIGI